jgi:hypothetical protein
MAYIHYARVFSFEEFFIFPHPPQNAIVRNGFIRHTSRSLPRTISAPSLRGFVLIELRVLVLSFHAEKQKKKLRKDKEIHLS